MRILKEQAVGVLIDVQEKLVPHMHEMDQVLEKQVMLVKGLRQLEVPVLVTEQYVRGLGKTLPELQELVNIDEAMEKMAFSCYDDAAFAEKLRETGRKTVILFGIETHVCVLQTVLDLVENGYQPVVIEDCVSSRKPADKATALRRMAQEGAVITSAESILFELCRVAGTDGFKVISRLVK